MVVTRLQLEKAEGKDLLRNARWGISLGIFCYKVEHFCKATYILTQVYAQSGTLLRAICGD